MVTGEDELNFLEKAGLASSHSKNVVFTSCMAIQVTNSDSALANDKNSPDVDLDVIYQGHVHVSERLARPLLSLSNVNKHHKMQEEDRQTMTRLQSRLALHRFICREFGYDDLDAMLERLRDARGVLLSGGESDYAQALSPHPSRARVPAGQFANYDANIVEHSHRLRMTEEHGRTWKPHQYLALLFTEHYLHRYFDDLEALCADLNQEKDSHRPTAGMPDYTVEDLHTLAFQSATGSGKTLLMHAHILQYQHYLKRAGRRLNNIVLVTPNEQMSVQHEREMRESGLGARLFSSEASSDLFQTVEIIDLNKLADKKA